MDITRNGGPPQNVVENMASLNQLSPDGNNLEIRVHCVARDPSAGLGNGVVIGEVVFRSFRGGPNALQHLIDEGCKVARNVLVQSTSGLVLPVK